MGGGRQAQAEGGRMEDNLSSSFPGNKREKSEGMGRKEEEEGREGGRRAGVTAAGGERQGEQGRLPQQQQQLPRRKKEKSEVMGGHCSYCQVQLGRNNLPLHLSGFSYGLRYRPAVLTMYILLHIR